MIGDEPLVDYNFIRIFKFENSPLEVLDEAVGWAESLVRERIERYREHYPWYRKYSF